jgi:hypothetical protein
MWTWWRRTNNQGSSIQASETQIFVSPFQFKFISSRFISLFGAVEKTMYFLISVFLRSFSLMSSTHNRESFSLGQVSLAVTVFHFAEYRLHAVMVCKIFF